MLAIDLGNVYTIRKYGTVDRYSKVLGVRRACSPNLKPAAVDWSEFDAVTDAGILASAVRDDPDAAPLADEEWFQKTQFVQPLNKVAINIRADQEVLDFFKSEGTGYQTRMNAVLALH